MEDNDFIKAVQPTTREVIWTALFVFMIVLAIACIGGY